MKKGNVKKNVRNIIFIMMMILMFSMMGQKVYAEGTAAYKEWTPTTGGSGLINDVTYKNTEKLSKELTYNMLKDSIYILCAERGRHIPSNRNTEYAYWTGNATAMDYIDGEKTDAELEGGGMERSDLEKYSTGWSDSPSELKDRVYVVENKAKYHKTGMEICTPAQAFILSEVEKNGGPNEEYYSCVQQAWWHSTSSKSSGNVKRNKLNDIADAYQTFVGKIAKGGEANVTNTTTYQSKTHNGVTIQFPKLKKKLVKLNKNTNKENNRIEVNFDKKTQTYKIGPFNLDYAEGESNGVNFGFIENMQVETNLGKIDIKEDRIIFGSKGINNYPKPNTDFYIVIDYAEGLTSIQRFNVTYKYLVVGGAYSPLEGNYDRTKYKIVEATKLVTENEGKENQTTKTQYSYKAQKIGTTGTQKSQFLTWVEKAARWYETVTTDVLLTDKEGSLEIYKRALNETGKELSSEEVRQKFGDYQYFDFKIEVKTGEKILFEGIERVKAGERLTMDFSWGNAEQTPTYKVTELVPSEESGWKYKGIKNESGTLKESGTVTVTATNQINKVKTGRIPIIKTIDEVATQSRTFRFKVTIQRGIEELDTDFVTVTVPAGELKSDPTYTKMFKWCGENPTYSIEEVKGDETVDIDGCDATGYYTLVKEYVKGDYKSDEKGFFKLAENGEKEYVDGKDENGYYKLKKEYIADVSTSSESEPNDSGLYENCVITPKEGTLKEGDNNESTVYAKNTNNKTKVSNLVIQKELKEGQTASSETFYFNIELGNTGSGNLSYEKVPVKVGEPFQLAVEWKGVKVGEEIRYDVPPTYKVTEVDKNGNAVDSSTIESIDVVQGGVIQDHRTGTNTIEGQLDSGNEIGSSETSIKTVKFTDKLQEHKGIIKVKKEAESETKVNPADVNFNIRVVVKGDFTYNNTTYTENGEALIIEKTIKGNQSFTTDDIIWYGSKAPTYTVEEYDIELGWQLIGVEYLTQGNEQLESEQHVLKTDKTVEVVVKNKLPKNIIIDLLFPMGGMVWVDEALEEKNTDKYYGEANGVYDKGETLKDNVKVIVYRVIYEDGKEIIREEAKAYESYDYETDKGVDKTFPVITGEDGRWDVEKVLMPGFDRNGIQFKNPNGNTEQRLNKELKNNFKEFIKHHTIDYDVEFIYDGQTYEPTKFLSYKVKENGAYKEIKGNENERAKQYKSETSVADRKEYAKDSMALMYDRGKVITEVSGETPIKIDGTTTGKATFTDGQQAEINYTSDNAGEGYPTISEVITTDNEGKALGIFEATARTSKGNLTFPFDVNRYNGSTLVHADTTIDENGVTEKYKFMTIYDYCQNINLGLVERPPVDIGLTKKLENAKVVVNEKLYEYKYSGAYDLTQEKQSSLYQTICDAADADIDLSYQLGLYQSDYYYRAELYKEGDERLYNKLTDFYQKVFKDATKSYTDSEMDIYLTYNIEVANNSGIYKVKINGIDDYYEQSLQLVSATEQKYLKTKTTGGEETDVNGLETVAVPSYIEGDQKTVSWKNVERIMGSDKDKDENIYYNKMTTENLDICLDPGDVERIKVTFKVNKNDTTNDYAKNAIILGQKCNVAEIASYSTYFANENDCYCKKYNLPNHDVDNYGHLAGKIDRDSAPGNVNISQLNEKKYYEDDTFAAPKIEVNLLTTERTINGLAWEDDSSGTDDNKTEKPGYNQTVGNGIKQDGEEAIGDLTTELVEKVMVQNEDGTYTEYDFIWPTDQTLEQLKDKSIETVCGFDSTITTSNESGKEGTYTFNNVPAGDYVVRFTYGDKEIKSASYSESYYYNGQDYKSTKYKAEVVDGATDGTVKPSAYLDLEKHLNSTESERHNSAADSEVRRLEVVNNSREITYENNKILAAAMSDEDLIKKNGENQENINENRKELLQEKDNTPTATGEDKKYYMYADTPKIDMNIESKQYQNGAGKLQNDEYTQYYNVNNVDFGLEERPATKLTLDKQIEEIILTTSDGNTIMDAKYNINYVVDSEDGSITAKVTLDTANSYGTDNLQALNRDEATNHGFRYINVDSRILEGTTITVKYRFTVLNTGEVDRTGRLVKIGYTDAGVQELNSKIKDLKEKLANYSKTEDGKTLKNDTTLGQYVGSIYYYGKDGNQTDAVVTTTVRQLVDYVDNDASFSGTLNATPNTSWSNITAEELDKKIKHGIVTSNEDGSAYTITDADDIQYETENRNNLAVSVDSYGVTGNDELNNKDFIVELVPTQALSGDNQITDKSDQAYMNLTVTRYVGTDSDDLQIDNIAEIIKYNNKVGRRDILTIAGNQSPKSALDKTPDLTGNKTVSQGMPYERDTSATEVITLSPPFGTGLTTWRLQVIGSIVAGLTIVAGGIVFIKKKILK